MTYFFSDFLSLLLHHQAGRAWEEREECGSLSVDFTAKKDLFFKHFYVFLGPSRPDLLI